MRIYCHDWKENGRVNIIYLYYFTQNWLYKQFGIVSIKIYPDLSQRTANTLAQSRNADGYCISSNNSRGRLFPFFAPKGGDYSREAINRGTEDYYFEEIRYFRHSASCTYFNPAFRSYFGSKLLIPAFKWGKSSTPKIILRTLERMIWLHHRLHLFGQLALKNMFP